MEILSIRFCLSVKPAIDATTTENEEITQPGIVELWHAVEIFVTISQHIFGIEFVKLWNGMLSGIKLF